jgi:hypothetical protein
VFEASHTETTSAAPAALWALWSDPGRWPEWNQTIEHGELEGEFARGETIRVKIRRGGRMQRQIVALDPERLLVEEARFPGARLGHEHRIQPNGDRCEVTHRVYVSGPMSGFWALMLGRKRLRQSVVGFVERERELLEGDAP